MISFFVQQSLTLSDACICISGKNIPYSLNVYKVCRIIDTHKFPHKMRYKFVIISLFANLLFAKHGDRTLMGGVLDQISAPN